MKKVLHVYPQLNCGGTEMVIHNLIKFGNSQEFQYEILTQEKGDNEKIFTDIGCQIHRIPFTNCKEYGTSLSTFLKNGHYDVVHAHMHNMIPTIMAVAQTANIPHRIVHSHNARLDIPFFLWPLRILKYHGFEKYATDFFGCSQLALKWLFPSKWRHGVVIHNGIDLEKFRFDTDTRKRIRKENSIGDDTKVFINIGRCTAQKNQKFILDIAAETSDKNYLFVIIGDGPLLEVLKTRVEHEHLTNVLLTGKRNNVSDWLSAADMFLFPSIYEGLGIVAVEAQASGLPVITSEKIPDEADMRLGLFKRLPLSDTLCWRKALDDDVPSLTDRQCVSDRIIASDYNIKTVTKTVESIYSK